MDILTRIKLMTVCKSYRERFVEINRSYMSTYYTLVKHTRRIYVGYVEWTNIFYELYTCLINIRMFYIPLHTTKSFRLVTAHRFINTTFNSGEHLANVYVTIVRDTINTYLHECKCVMFPDNQTRLMQTIAKINDHITLVSRYISCILYKVPLDELYDGFINKVVTCLGLTFNIVYVKNFHNIKQWISDMSADLRLQQQEMFLLSSR